MRASLVPCFAVAFAPISAAQTVLPDAQPEGASFTTLTIPWGTLRDLDRGTGSAPDAFVIDDATAFLRFERGFTAPNLVNFGPAVPGPDAELGRCKSFVIDLGGLGDRLRVALWVSRSHAGNVLRFDMRAGAASVEALDIPIPGGNAPLHLDLFLRPASLAFFDHVLVSSSGPIDGGTFRGALDFLVIGAPDSVPPPWCQTFSGGGNTPCPCGNDVPHPDQEGCLSSLGFGARLRAAGAASVSNDTLELLCHNLPATTAILVQGTPFVQTGAVFGDGVSCIGGALVRLASEHANGGELHHPDAGEQPLSVLGAVTPGSSMGYAVVYRNAAAFCTSATFNVSDTQPAVWGP